MKPLLLLFVLMLSSCPQPNYTRPGMSYKSFDTLCKVAVDEMTDGQSVTNASGRTFTIKLKDTDVRREPGCVGVFVFVNDKLDSISR